LESKAWESYDEVPEKYCICSIEKGTSGHSAASEIMVPPPVVFTHSSLRPRNIMVNDEVVTGIVDWECGGWYPENWGFSRVLNIWKW
jgi:hypothetical protein